ncbi:hypothetical protein [Clostridium oceanicum]|uniref:Uncharacterized protein n=1 Tax=Clostridium oceanicum TaxID=1543 RepID=A0ABP3UWV6_9CLOT
MKKRWLIYTIIGVAFGVLDEYYQEFVQGMITSVPMWFILAWGIWLIPIIPIVLHEAKVSKSRIKAALANVLTWSSAVISYYVFIAIKLIFIGQSSMNFIYSSNYKDEFYFSNLKSFFYNSILSGITEWIGIAIVGGFITGFSISFIYLRIRRTPRKFKREIVL